MSIPSGGASLGPQDPTSIDATDTQQTGAASQSQRQQMGMVQDSLSQSLTQVGEGKIDVKGSEPNRPSLDHPVTTVQVAPGAKETATQQAVQEKYQEFLEQLPVELQMKIIQNGQLPVAQQDPALTLLAAGIMNEATMTVWAQQVNASDPGSQAVKGEDGQRTTKGEGVLDADGKPIPGQANVNAKGEQQGDGTDQGNKQGPTPGGQQASAQFWSNNSAVPGASAREFVQANLPPGASTIAQAQLAAANGIPGPLAASLSNDIQKLLVAANGIQVLTAQQTTLQAAVKATPPDDPNSMVLGDFLKVIGEAIDACKTALRKMMQLQTDIERKDSVAKTDAMMSKLKAQLEKLEKAHDAGKGNGGTGKLVGMIILAIAAAVLTVITGGIMAVVLCETVVGAIAAIAVTIAIAVVELVFTITSSVTSYNVVAKIMKLLAEMLNAFGIPSPTAEILIAVVVLVVAILAIVAALALVVFCPEGMAMVAQLTMQLVMTISTTVIANSNCVSTVLVPIMTAMGIPKDIAEIISQVIAMLLILILVLCTLAVGIRAMGNAGEAGAEAVDSTASTAANATKTIKSTGTEAEIAASKQVNTVAKMSEGTAESVPRSTSVLNKLNGKFSPETIKKVLDGLNALDALGQVGVQTGHAAMALGQAIIMFKRAQLAMEIGDLDMFIAEANAYLKMLDATMQGIQKSIEQMMTGIANLSNLMSHIIQSQSQIISALERIS